LKWSHPTTIGNNIIANLYDNYVTYIKTLFSGNASVLNGTHSVFFDCSYNYTKKYSFLLNNDGNICETAPIMINLCGNGQIDYNKGYYEECDKTLGCNEECRCDNTFYAVLNSNNKALGCCGGVCQLNNSIQLVNNTDLKNKTLKVNNNLIIGNGSVIEIDTGSVIETGCLINHGLVNVQLNNNNNFSVIKSKCKFNISQIHLTGPTRGCSTAQPQIKQKGGFYVFEVNFVNSCNSASNIKNGKSLLWLWLVIGMIGVIVVIMVLLAIFHKGFQKKVFPWRHQDHNQD